MMQQLAGKNEAQITMKISFFGTVSVDGSEILHQLIDSLSHDLRGFVHPRWLFGISEPSTVFLHRKMRPKWLGVSLTSSPGDLFVQLRS